MPFFSWVWNRVFLYNVIRLLPIYLFAFVIFYIKIFYFPLINKSRCQYLLRWIIVIIVNLINWFLMIQNNKSNSSFAHVIKVNNKNYWKMRNIASLSTPLCSNPIDCIIINTSLYCTLSQKQSVSKKLPIKIFIIFISRFCSNRNAIRALKITINCGS